MPIQYAELQNSKFADLTRYESNSTQLPTGSPASSHAFNLALVLDRANPATDLLDADWASRQTQIEQLNQLNTLWSTYGADQQKFNYALAELNSLGFMPFSNTVNGQYVTSAESHTIWVTVDESNFETLFGTALLEGFTPAPQQGLFSLIKFWENNLSLPQEPIDAGIVGLWFDRTGSADPLRSRLRTRGHPSRRRPERGELRRRCEISQRDRPRAGWLRSC